MRIRTRFAIALGTLLLAATAAPSPVDAQEQLTFPHYRIGFAAGANLADMSDTDDADFRTGFALGTSLMIQLSDKFSLQPELYYSQKGVKGRIDDPEAGSISLTLKNDYIELPLLARWTFGDRMMSLRPFVVGGPTLAVVSSCEAEGSSGGASASIDCDEFADVNNFEFGGVAGVGLQFPVGRSLMSVGARYTMGFSKVFDGADAKNRAVSLLVGLAF